jgi:hypothetical protein
MTITDKRKQTLAVAIEVFANSICRALTSEHLELKKLEWWCDLQTDIEHIKTLRRLLYQLECEEAEPKDKECAE